MGTAAPHGFPSDATLPSTPEPPTADGSAASLMAQLNPLDRQHWIATACLDDQGLTVQLQVVPAFSVAPVEQRQRWVERCWQELQRQGYDGLQVVDGSGTLLARQALVGSGMILLDPPHPG